MPIIIGAAIFLLIIFLVLGGFLMLVSLALDILLKLIIIAILIGVAVIFFKNYKKFIKEV